MYGLTSTRKNTRNKSFFIGKMKKDKIGKSLLIDFLPNLASQIFFWKGLILFYIMLTGELCLEANKDAIINKGIIEVEKTV